MNVATHPFDVLSLFSGAGGLDLGLRLAIPGSRVVAYVEREAYAAATLVARMEDATLDPAPVWDDVSTFDGRPWRGIVDCVAGGFPCQDISVAGRGAGIRGARSGLWSEFARIIREVGPDYVFVENVEALAVRGLDTVLGDLAGLGFDAEWSVFSAAAVGAPHLRKRLFILAGLSDAIRNPLRQFPEWDLLEQAERWDAVARHHGGERNASDGRAVADAARLGVLADPVAAERRAKPARWYEPDRCDARRPKAADGSAACRPFVADAEHQGCGQRSEDHDANGRDALGNNAHRRHPLPVFPPGRGDIGGWWHLLAEYPEVTPAIERRLRRSADGLATRLEQRGTTRIQRLHVLGNGVVPLTAALAWCELADRLRGA